MITIEVKEVGINVNDNVRVRIKVCLYHTKALISYDRQVNLKFRLIVVKLYIKPIRFSFQNE